MDLKNYKLKESKQKIDFSYQDLGIEMQAFFKKNIWHLFHKPEYTEEMIRDAFMVCKRSKVAKVDYLVGVLKQLSIK